MIGQQRSLAPGGQRCLPAPVRLRYGTSGRAPPAIARRGAAGEQTGLDRLADAHVIGDEQPYRVKTEGHEQGDELVRARLDSDSRERSERAGARPKTEPDGVPKELR